MSVSTQSVPLGNFFAPSPSQNWTRRAGHAMTVVGDFVYIDGGEVAIGAEPWSYSIKGPNYTPVPVNCTLTINIGQGWNDPSVVQYGAIPKPQAPVLDYSQLWYDNKTNSLYSFGGEQSKLDQAQLDMNIWRLDLDGNGGGTWHVNSSAKDAPYSQGITRPFGGNSASNNQSAWYVGGLSSSKTSTSLQSIKDDVPLPGVVSYNFQNHTWTNTSTAGTPIAPDGSFEWGGVQSVPLGPNGIVAIWGGETSNSSAWSAGQNERTISTITIFDPNTKSWYSQNTTGLPPTARNKFCWVGVSDTRPTSNSPYGTSEIYMYGGYGGTYGTGAQNYDEMWVLTLPAFQWIILDGSHKSARIGHTCAVIGGSQMLSIGGLDPSQEDPWSTPDLSNWNGIGIFNMATASWSGGFNISAGPYTRPKQVQDVYDKNGAYPATWAQQGLHDLLAATPPTPQAANSSSPSMAPVTKHQPNVAAIAGGVAGGAAALLFACILFFCIRRRQRKQHRPSISRPYPTIPELSTVSRRDLRMTQNGLADKGFYARAMGSQSSGGHSPPPRYCIEMDGGELDGGEVARELSPTIQRAMMASGGTPDVKGYYYHHKSGSIMESPVVTAGWHGREKSLAAATASQQAYHPVRNTSLSPIDRHVDQMIHEITAQQRHGQAKGPTPPEKAVSPIVSPVEGAEQQADYLQARTFSPIDQR